MSLAIFGISSGGLSLAINLLVLFLVVTWLALIYWTYLDARRRLEDPVLIACATAASVFPFVGTVVYTIVRPPEFLEDKEERDLEVRASELRVRQLIEQSCPHCEYPIERSYLRCPNCERRLKSPCRNCRKPLDPRWGICPYCETEVRREKGQARGRERDRPTRAPRQQRTPGTRPKGRPATRTDAPRQPTGGAVRAQRSQRSSGTGERRVPRSGEGPRGATAS
jgi:hypothetical protein